MTTVRNSSRIRQQGTTISLAVTPPSGFPLQEFTKLIKLDFCIPKTTRELVRYIPIDKQLFDLACHQSTTVSTPEGEALYQAHRIKKRNSNRLGQFRVVWQAMPEELSIAYKSFALRFDFFLRSKTDTFPNDFSFGYVRGRNILENAKVHSGQYLIARADIRNFFPSITLKRISNKFINLGIEQNIATKLSHFICIDSTLPCGLPSSPLIANYVCNNLDIKLRNLAEQYECNYSRYADDITFSSNHTLPDKDEIAKVLESECFELSERKFRTTKRGQSHFVTGLSVSDSNSPRIPKALKRQLRQELYYCQKYGIISHLQKSGFTDYEYQQQINRIDGTVKYVGYIEKEQFPQLKDQWKSLLKKELLQPSFEPIANIQSRFVEFYIDESEITLDGKPYLFLCCAVDNCSRVTRETTERVLRDHISSPFADGRTEVLMEKGLHYADATEDLKKEFINHLQSLPTYSYVSAILLESYDTYAEKYETLLKQILPNRLQWCDGQTVHITVEENPRVKKERIKSIITGIETNLQSNNDRRPKKLHVFIKTKKEEPNIAVPDFYLGVLGKAIREAPNAITPKRKDDPTPRSLLLYESLRIRYRKISIVNTNQVFTRRHPFDPILFSNKRNSN